MRCTPTIHELIVLTLPPRHRCPLTWLPASRLLLPRSGLERSDFVHWHNPDMPRWSDDVCFSNRPFGVKLFQTIHQCDVDVARGLVLLFGIGTGAFPSWDSRTRRNNLLAALPSV
jgi:hypothetical protein